MVWLRLPVPRSLRVSRTLFFTMTWQSPCCAPSLLAAADRFTLFFRFRSFWAGLLLLFVVLSTSLRCWDHMQGTLFANFTKSFHLAERHYVACFSIWSGRFSSYADLPVSYHKRSLPFRTVNMRALGFRPLALDWSFEEQATMTLPPCTFWEVATWFGWCLLSFYAVASISNLYPMLQRHLLSFRSWQKGDRPDNGDVEPCSIQPKKTGGVLWFVYLSHISLFWFTLWSCNPSKKIWKSNMHHLLVSVCAILNPKWCGSHLEVLKAWRRGGSFDRSVRWGRWRWWIKLYVLMQCPYFGENSKYERERKKEKRKYIFILVQRDPSEGRYTLERPSRAEAPCKTKMKRGRG